MDQISGYMSMFVLVSFQVFPRPRFSQEGGFYECPRDGMPRRLVGFHLGGGIPFSHSRVPRSNR